MGRWLIGALVIAVVAAGSAIYALFQLAAAVPLTATTGAASFWAAFVAALGSLLTLAASKLCELAIAADARQRERREMLTALCAEICSKIKRQRKAFAPANRAAVFGELSQFIAIEETLKAAESGLYRSSVSAKRSESSRFATADPDDAVYSSLRQKLYTLPPQIVASCVVYYNLDAMINKVLISVDSNQFDEISASRKAGIYAELYALANEVDATAELALIELRSALIALNARDIADLPAMAPGTAWKPFARSEAEGARGSRTAKAAGLDQP